jgi:hypothetical protein
MKALRSFDTSRNDYSVKRRFNSLEDAEGGGGHYVGSKHRKLNNL